MADITSNLLHYWALDENTGTNADDQGSGALDGTLSGTTGLPTWVAPGKVGTSHLSFVTANLQRVIITGSETESITGAMTVAAWANWNIVSIAATIFSKMGGAGARAWTIELQADNSIIFYVSADNTAFTSVQTTGLTVAADTWYHVVGVYTPSTSMKIYINGSLNNTNVTSIPAAQDTNNNQTIRIGTRSGGGGQYIDGLVDECRVYTRALADADVLALYNYPASTYGLSALMAAGHF